MLHGLGFTGLQPRPYRPKKNVVVREAFKDGFARLIAALVPAGRPQELWFTDEARVRQRGTLTYVWARRGSRPSIVWDNRDDSVYLLGAVFPERCVRAAIIILGMSGEAMAEHLKEIGRRVAPGAHAVLTLDNAGSHQAGDRSPAPANLTLLPLPPYAPQLTPAESTWEFLRGNFLSRRTWDTYNATLKARRDAWNKLMRMPGRTASLTNRPRTEAVTGRGDWRYEH